MTDIRDRPFRDRFLTPRVARTMTAPSSILLLGGAGAAGILLGGPVIGAVAAVGAYGARVLAAVPRRGRDDQIDPMQLRSPWRDYVQETMVAQRRYAKIVADTRPGPLRDRLAQIGERIQDGVRESWRIAQRGQVLEDGLHQLQTTQANRQLAAARAELERAPSESTRQRVASLEAQVATAERIIRVGTDAADRLRLLDARLDEMVARAVELSLSGDQGQLHGLDSDVDTLVGEMEALRLALEETGGGSATMGVN